MVPEQLHAKKRSFVEIPDKDLKILALDLRAKEYQVRSQFTPTRIVSKLANKEFGTKFRLSNHSLEVGG